MRISSALFFGVLLTVLALSGVKGKKEEEEEPMRPQDIEDCVACHYIWNSVERDLGNELSYDAVYDSFSGHCHIAQQTHIFYPACRFMTTQAIETVNHYIRGSDVTSICKFLRMCPGGLEPAKPDNETHTDPDDGTCKEFFERPDACKGLVQVPENAGFDCDGVFECTKTCCRDEDEEADTCSKWLDDNVCTPFAVDETKLKTPCKMVGPPLKGYPPLCGVKLCCDHQTGGDTCAAFWKDARCAEGTEEDTEVPPETKCRISDGTCQAKCCQDPEPSSDDTCGEFWDAKKCLAKKKVKKTGAKRETLCGKNCEATCCMADGGGGPVCEEWWGKNTCPPKTRPNQIKTCSKCKCNARNPLAKDGCITKCCAPKPTKSYKCARFHKEQGCDGQKTRNAEKECSLTAAKNAANFCKTLCCEPPVEKYTCSKYYKEVTCKGLPKTDPKPPKDVCTKGKTCRGICCDLRQPAKKHFEVRVHFVNGYGQYQLFDYLSASPGSTRRNAGRYTNEWRNFPSTWVTMNKKLANAKLPPLGHDGEKVTLYISGHASIVGGKDKKKSVEYNKLLSARRVRSMGCHVASWLAKKGNVKNVEIRMGHHGSSGKTGRLGAKQQAADRVAIVYMPENPKLAPTFKWDGTYAGGPKSFTIKDGKFVEWRKCFTNAAMTRPLYGRVPWVNTDDKGKSRAKLFADGQYLPNLFQVHLETGGFSFKETGMSTTTGGKRMCFTTSERRELEKYASVVGSSDISAPTCTSGEEACLESNVYEQIQKHASVIDMMAPSLKHMTKFEKC